MEAYTALLNELESQIEAGLLQLRPKKVLVACSSLQGKDYPKSIPIINKLAGQNHQVTFLPGKEASFPEDIPKDVLYNFVFFTGCNVVKWIFKTPNALLDLLKALDVNGKIIFLELVKGTHGQTIHAVKIDDLHYNLGVSEVEGHAQFLEDWNSKFAETHIGDIIAYAKRPT